MNSSAQLHAVHFVAELWILSESISKYINYIKASLGLRKACDELSRDALTWPQGICKGCSMLGRLWLSVYSIAVRHARM